MGAVIFLAGLVVGMLIGVGALALVSAGRHTDDGHP